MPAPSPPASAVLVLLAVLATGLACGDEAPAPGETAEDVDPADATRPLTTEVGVFNTSLSEPQEDSLFLAANPPGGGTDRYSDPKVEPSHDIAWNPYSEGTLYVRFEGDWPFQSEAPANGTREIDGSAVTETLRPDVNGSCSNGTGPPESDCIAYTAWVIREAEGDSVAVYGTRPAPDQPLRTRPRILIDRPDLDSDTDAPSP